MILHTTDPRRVHTKDAKGIFHASELKDRQQFFWFQTFKRIFKMAKCSMFMAIKHVRIIQYTLMHRKTLLHPEVK
jgi:hypothetical protein